MNPGVANEVESLHMGGLLRLFEAVYLSHLFLPSLIFFALVELPPGDLGSAAMCIIASAFLVSASQHALRQTTIFSERSLRRIIHRTMMLVAVISLSGVFAYFSMIPFVVLSAAIGSDLIAYGWLILILSFVFARQWPVYVVQYLYRGTQADAWKDLFSAKLPDAAIAWRLTRVPAAFRRATLPVMLGVLAVFLVYALSTSYLLTSKSGVFFFYILYYLGVLPFVHLLIVERAIALAVCSEDAAAAALYVKDAGPLWWTALGASYYKKSQEERLGEPLAPSERPHTPPTPASDTFHRPITPQDRFRVQERKRKENLRHECEGNPTQLLEYAISEGRADWFDEALELGADINGKDKSGRTLVMLAAIREQEEMLRRLLDLGADVNALSRGIAALHSAVYRAHNIEIIKLLLMAGADVNARNNGSSALARACQRIDDSPPILEMLKSAGARIEPRPLEGISPLMEAARAGNMAAVNWLLDQGAELEYRTQGVSWNGWTALAFAVAANQMDVVKLLLSRGADPKQRIDDRTLIMIAADWNRYDMIKFLRKQGVDPRAKDKNGHTALYYAEFQDRPDSKVINLLKTYLEKPA